MGKVKTEGIQSEIMDPQHVLQAEFDAASSLTIDDKCKKYNDLIAIRLERLDDLQDIRAGLDLDTSEEIASAEKCDREISQLQAEIEVLREEVYRLENNSDKSQNIVENNNVFDKNRVFKNIRTLLSSTGVKLGQIERDAGCQPGYMSRLEKPSSTTDPSMGFVVTAAKALGVSIDFLVYEDYEKLTETERYILKFLNNLINDTREDKLIWKTNTMGRYVESEQSGGDSGDSLFNYLIALDTKTDTTRYNSMFSHKTLSCTGSSYAAELKGTDAKIYIMNCLDDSAQPNEIKQFNEIYILNNKKINPLLSTAQTRETLVAAVKQLFEAVEVSATHLHISSDVRSVIDRYLAAPTA